MFCLAAPTYVVVRGLLTRDCSVTRYATQRTTMATFARRRPKLVLFPTKAALQAKAAQTEDDYAVYASYRPSSCGRFIGTLKVIRLTDARLLYPFEGAEDIGPFSAKDAAREAAIQRGREIIQADLQHPEL